MELSEDKVKLINILQETLLLLCKNGLRYSTELEVEALVVITIDRKETFHTSIKGTTLKECESSKTKSRSHNEESPDHQATTIQLRQRKNDLEKRRKPSEESKDNNSADKSLKSPETRHSVKSKKSKVDEENQATQKEKLSSVDEGSARYSLRKRTSISPDRANKSSSKRHKRDTSNPATTERKEDSTPSSKDSKKTVGKSSSEDKEPQDVSIAVHIKEEKEDDYEQVSNHTDGTLSQLKMLGTIKPVATPQNLSPSKVFADLPVTRSGTITEPAGSSFNLSTSTKHSVLNLAQCTQIPTGTKHSRRKSAEAQVTFAEREQRHMVDVPSKRKERTPCNGSGEIQVQTPTVIDIRPQQEINSPKMDFTASAAIALPPEASMTVEDVETILKKYNSFQRPDGITVRTLEYYKGPADPTPPRSHLSERAVGVFQCTVCTTKFFKESNYQKHLLEHTDKT